MQLEAHPTGVAARLTRRATVAAGVNTAVLVFAAAATAAAGEQAEEQVQAALQIGLFSRTLSDRMIERGTAPGVQDFARLEAAEQGTLIRSLLGQTDAAEPVLSTGHAEGLREMASLDAGAALDAAYLEEERKGHLSLRAVYRGLATGRDMTDPVVVIAALAVTEINSHLKMIEMIRRAA